jgi:VWFA-related protein
VTVGLVELTVHASDRSGNPVSDLKASDFRLLVDGAAVEIDSLEWSGIQRTGESAAVSVPAPSDAGAPADESSGRLMVLLFQWEIQAQKAEGHMRMARQALEFLDTLKPADRVAVLAFGSRLWLRQDFTNDRAKLRAAVLDALVAKDGESNAAPPSLGAVVPAGAQATSIEKALGAIGKALRPLPGAKAILFFGWGVGSWSALSADRSLGRVSFSREYQEASLALQQAQAPVFTLDISGGSHGLAAGLEALSFETGGYYLPTHDFPRWAMKTVERAVSGHYALVFRPPAGTHGKHTIQLLSPRPLVLLYRQSYEN